MDIELENFRPAEPEATQNASITSLDPSPGAAQAAVSSSASLFNTQHIAFQHPSSIFWTLLKTLYCWVLRMLWNGILKLWNLRRTPRIAKRLYASAKKYRVQLLKALALLATLALSGISLYYQWMSVKLTQLQVMIALEDRCKSGNDCRVGWDPLCIQYFGKPNEPCNVMGNRGPWFPMAVTQCIREQILFPEIIQAVTHSVNYFYGTSGYWALGLALVCLSEKALSTKKRNQQAAVIILSTICVIVVGIRYIPIYQGRLVAACASSVLNATMPVMSSSLQSLANALLKPDQRIRTFTDLAIPYSSHFYGIKYSYMAPLRYNVKIISTRIGWYGLFAASVFVLTTLGSYLRKRRPVIWLLRALIIVISKVLLEKIKEELWDLRDTAFANHLNFCVSDHWLANQTVCTSSFGVPKGPWLMVEDSTMQDQQSVPMDLLEQCLALRFLRENLTDLAPWGSSGLVGEGWWITFGWSEGLHLYGSLGNRVQQALHFWAQDVGSSRFKTADWAFHDQPLPFDCWSTIPIYCLTLAMTLSPRTVHLKILFWISLFVVFYRVLLPQWRLTAFLRSTSFCFNHALNQAPSVSGHWNWRLNAGQRRKLWGQRLELAKRWLLPVIIFGDNLKQLWSWDDFLDRVLKCAMGVYMMPKVHLETRRNSWWVLADLLLSLYGIAWWFSDYAR